VKGKPFRSSEGYLGRLKGWEIINFIGGHLEKLKGYQKQYLKGLAHGLKPYVFIGQKGIAESLIKSVDEALDKHELIKVRFIDFKEKDMKKEITAEIEKRTDCELVGAIGHVAIFYRQQKDPGKRVIRVPDEKKGPGVQGVKSSSVKPKKN